LRKPR